MGDYPVVALLGPRQVGKTTLVKLLIKSIRDEAVHHFLVEVLAGIKITTEANELAEGAGADFVVFDHLLRYFSGCLETEITQITSF